jgi:FKBP-type peptidyl-prolyl cis-trans isomerase
MLNNWNKLLVFFFGLLLLSACQEQFPGFEESGTGVYYKVHHRGTDSIKPQLSDWVVINMDYRLEDTLMFSSKNLDEPLRFPIIQPMFDGDLYEGLQMMVVGDSMTFAVVADSFFFKTAFLKQLPPNVKPGSPMYYDVKLLQRYSQEEHQLKVQEEGNKKLEAEFERRYQYLKENQIKTEPTPSGLYFIRLKKGNGRKPVAGEMCSVFLTVSNWTEKNCFLIMIATPLRLNLEKNLIPKD